MKRKPIITAEIVDDSSSRQFTVRGQYARTLEALLEAGNRGTTALEISTWALRLSHYVHILRTEYRLTIEMQLEPHETGRHGRYFLRSDVHVISKGKTAGAEMAA